MTGRRTSGHRAVFGHVAWCRAFEAHDVPRYYRSRESGDPVSFDQRRWIPAFAGMTQTRFRGDDANSPILSRMCVAPPAAPDGAAPSRDIMVFLVTIIFIIAVLLAALAGYAIGLRARAGHVLPEPLHASAPTPA